MLGSCVLVIIGENMAQIELDTYEIGNKQYVMLHEAARYLRMRMSDLEGQIALGKLEPIRDEGRDFIELEALKAYASNRSRQQSAWGRVDEFRGRAK